ncbi:DUF4190 domain-containing protein [Lacisediminihabitans sp. FW035]
MTDNYGRPGYPAYVYVAPARTNGLAVASFVLALLGFSILPVVLGHVALRQISARNEAGSAFAIIALVLGYIELIGIVLLIVLIVSGLGFAGFMSAVNSNGG